MSDLPAFTSGRFVVEATPPPGARLAGRLRLDGGRVAEVKLEGSAGATHAASVRWSGTFR